MRRKSESRLDKRIAAANAASKATEATSKAASKAVKPAEAATPAKAAAKPAKAPRAPKAAQAALVAKSAAQDSDRPAPKSFRHWLDVAKRTAMECRDDELLDRAAALTYYGFLAVFPTLLLAISILGLLGDSAVNKILENVQTLAPGSVRNVLRTAIQQVRKNRGTGGTLALAAIVGAMWSASGYVGAFIRASTVIYGGVREKRPIWKVLPLRIGLTMLMMLASMISVIIVVFTGPLAGKTASVFGLSHTAVTVWSILKWPVLVLLVAGMIVLLFWAAPDAHSGGFRWISPGSTLAVVLWLILSSGFAAYIANFASYNKTYGTVAGVIVFLLWLWLSNLAILLGLEFNAELARGQSREPAASP
ncbi:YihY/virulence factor BrkB family protein [Catenulispora rubra]|uniref:YihY/virulence factor BrkB family protein n=1 Tax=Catenulispora rubra TaxID=280293 RepID=UPI00189217D7|nr:YihY/virulence factor BrkB family protein [Catenulispora rubra]